MPELKALSAPLRVPPLVGSHLELQEFWASSGEKNEFEGCQNGCEWPSKRRSQAMGGVESGGSPGCSVLREKAWP